MYFPPKCSPPIVAGTVRIQHYDERGSSRIREELREYRIPGEVTEWESVLVSSANLNGRAETHRALITRRFPCLHLSAEFDICGPQIETKESMNGYHRSYVCAQTQLDATGRRPEAELLSELIPAAPWLQQAFSMYPLHRISSPDEPLFIGRPFGPVGVFCLAIGPIAFAVRAIGAAGWDGESFSPTVPGMLGLPSNSLDNPSSAGSARHPLRPNSDIHAENPGIERSFAHAKNTFVIFAHRWKGVSELERPFPGIATIVLSGKGYR
ncbi:hypothetical protein NMY22_g5519 [Coprinellus aureogranulatus]|nr:hypothetical protein NMY22_g5519 [Coprinellus aureogranulatus]